MKEFNVICIECTKDVKFSGLFEQIDGMISHKRNIFEILNLKNLSAKKKTVFDSLKLEKFFHIKKLPHLVKSEDYDPEEHDRKLFSNLSEDWEWNNPNCSDSISKADAQRLLAFYDSLTHMEFSTLFFGFDEISWAGETPQSGTYGYEKAFCTHRAGENYLSNSIIMKKIAFDKKVYAFLSCESRFRECDKVNELISLIGKVKNERILYAPSDADERSEWEAVYAEYSEKYKNMKAGLKELYEKLPNEIKHYTYAELANLKTPINVAKIAKEYLSTDGWVKTPHYPKAWGTVYVKPKGDMKLSIDLISMYGGHYLQIMLTCSEKRFWFNENSGYCMNVCTEDDVRKYMENVVFIRDYFYEMM